MEEREREGECVCVLARGCTCTDCPTAGGGRLHHSKDDLMKNYIDRPRAVQSDPSQTSQIWCVRRLGREEPLITSY